MVNKKPPFKINEKIMTEVIDIAELVGKVSISSQISANPTLRRTNRIRTIYSSLAIEQYRSSNGGLIRKAYFCATEEYCGGTKRI